MTEGPSMSATIGNLADALAKAQAELEGAKKDKTNPAFRSKYADLGAVWDAWQETGPKHGLAIVQTFEPCEKGVMLRTTLLHAKSGEWISGVITIPATKQDAQGYGSAATYARRYALSAMVGIAPEDDDGNAAAASTSKPRVQRQPLPPRAPTDAENAAAAANGPDPFYEAKPFNVVEAMLREAATQGVAALDACIAKVRPDVRSWPKADQTRLVQLREAELLPQARAIDATPEPAGAAK